MTLRLIITLVVLLLTINKSYAEQITILNPSIMCRALLESSFSTFIKGTDGNNILVEFNLESESAKKVNTDMKFQYDYIVELYGLDSYMVFSKEKYQEDAYLSIPDYRLPCRAKWEFGNKLNQNSVQEASSSSRKEAKEDDISGFLADKIAGKQNEPKPREIVSPEYTFSSEHKFVSEVNAEVRMFLETNYPVPFILVDGEEVQFVDGSFSGEFYVPKIGTQIEVAISDPDGNLTYEYVELKRIVASTSILNRLERLKPKPVAAIQNPNDIAIVVGLSRYENTPNEAIFADRDASAFFDYANLSLGIPRENILELLNENAERIDIQKAIKIWLKQKVTPGSSNIYLFFAGHGLASDDGEDSYLIPFDGEPSILELSAISQTDLFKDLAKLSPAHVFAFFDTCYSGTTRADESLIASRPIGIQAKPLDIPENFTVFAAAGAKETARPAEEVKHGLFSYFTMLGLEGEADTNSDKVITTGELFSFVNENVSQWSVGQQNPQLTGDANKRLVTLK